MSTACSIRCRSAGTPCSARAGVRLQDGGRGAFVLAPFAGHLVGEHDHHIVAELLGEDLAGPQFMGGVHVGEQQRDGAEALVAGAAGRGPYGGLVERGQLGAARVEAAARLGGGVPVHERHGLAVVQVEHAVPFATGDLVDVAQPGRGEQQDAGALAFQQGVEALGGAVDEEGDVGGVVDRPAQRGEDALGEVSRCGGGPRRFEGAARLVVRDDNGECATDVHGHPVSHVASGLSQGTDVTLSAGRGGRLRTVHGVRPCAAPGVSRLGPAAARPRGGGRSARTPRPGAGSRCSG